MKKRICMILSILFTVSCLSVYANQDIKVFVDNKQVTFDVLLQLIGGRTMVPLRAIFEALGATVEWDESNQTITAYNEAYIVKSTVGSNEMYVNNSKLTIDVPPMIVDNRTLVPARFIAEAFGCDVEWNADDLAVIITSKPIDYGSLEQENSTPSSSNPTEEPPIQTANGTRLNPYYAFDNAPIQYQEWSFEPIRTVSVTCTNMIRGNAANILANSENMFNDKPSLNEEWCFLEFDLKYISSTGGSDDLLEGSDIIYKDTFFDLNGSAIAVKDMATLGDIYEGYGVFDTEVYPGGKCHIVIGILINKNIGDILLRVPNKSLNTNTWIYCNK